MQNRKRRNKEEITRIATWRILKTARMDGSLHLPRILWQPLTFTISITVKISKNVKRSANSDRSANHLIYLNSGDDFLEICKIVWKSKGDNLPSTDKITGVGRAVPEPSMNNQWKSVCPRCTCLIGRAVSQKVKAYTVQSRLQSPMGYIIYR